jgi:hypothetical protein
MIGGLWKRCGGREEGREGEIGTHTCERRCFHSLLQNGPFTNTQTRLLSFDLNAHTKIQWETFNDPDAGWSVVTSKKKPKAAKKVGSEGEEGGEEGSGAEGSGGEGEGSGAEA